MLGHMLYSYAWCQAAVVPPVDFDEYFLNKAIRLELYQCGNAREQTTTIHALAEETCWPESPKNLLTPFPYGKFLAKVHDTKTDRLIYTRGFDTLFAEYATTPPARGGAKRVFETTVRIPMPKASVRVTIEKRNPDNTMLEILAETIEPNDVRIHRELVSSSDKPIDLHITGPAHERVDLVFLAEGYTADQEEKFTRDAKRMTDYLFSIAPYKAAKPRFNVRGVFRASVEAGTDQPNEHVFHNTVLNASFNTLGIDRYLLLEENHRMHQMAARVPYDTIVVLVNSTVYGGGSICLDFCVCSADSSASALVFAHELGHGLAYLADEYVGNVSYSDMYPEGVEPVEPNITRQLDRDQIKWRAFLTKEVALPTRSQVNPPGGNQVNPPGGNQVNPPSGNQVNPTGGNIVGAFEGGGYLAKGMYRSQQKCWMGSNEPSTGFCAACSHAIEQMIDYYSPPVLQPSTSDAPP